MKGKKLFTGILALMLMVFTGCEDKIDPLIEELEGDRQFTPTEIEITEGQTQAEIEWEASLNANENETSYFVEVSKDLTFTVVEFSTTVETNQAIVSNEDIEIKQDHYVRVKTLGKEGQEDSHWIVSEAFQITGEQIFQEVQEADLSTTSVNLKWTAASGVTHIVVTPENGTPVEYEVSDEEETAKAKLISGLTPGVLHVAEIFNGETSRGTTEFSTFSIEVPDADLIVFLGEGDVFTQETFDTLTVSSVTFVFLQGSVYGSNTALILKSNVDITFFGEPGANKPVMAFNGFTLPTTGGQIHFENVDLTGFEYVGGVPTATKRAYIFNQSLASHTEEVSFENCIIRNFENTPFRIQGANTITVDNLVVNNSIIYDISAGSQNYAFINNNATAGEVTNITLSNSTFYNVKIGLILHNAKPSQSVTITDCTVYDISADTRALVAYNAQAVTSFTFTNNIISKSKGVATVRGIRIAGASVSVPSNNYMTNDYIASSNPIGGITAYSGASTDLFVNPTTADFHFKDGSFAGEDTAGDPRWRP